MKKVKKLLSLFLIVTLLLCCVPITAYAAEGVAISYDFINDSPGFAQGTITVKTGKSDIGNYYLYWADDSSALDGYYEIAKMDVSSGEGSYTFLENIVIPADATTLIAIKSDTEPKDKSVENAQAVYRLPKHKLLPHTSADKTLSFEALSDTQIDEQSAVFYTYSLEHFAKALENAADRNVDFITTSGDCINNYENGTSKEWQTFQKIIADSSFTNPIYETNGNHSMKSDIAYGIEAYITATGLGVDSEGLQDKPWYEVTAKNGDHFLFAALETSDSVGNNDEFSDEQLDWLESTIEKYYADGHRIFVFEHAFFHGWGPGDDKVNHYYSGGLRTTEEYPGNHRFRAIFDKYTEVFLYTGHSHLDFQYNWNYDNEGGKTANMFHIPATACTTHVTNGKLDYFMDENNSQCYIVDCYDDMVITNGLGVVDNKIYPQYSYIVNTSDYTHEPVTQPTEESTTESSNLINVLIENETTWLYNGSAAKVAMYFYNNASGNYYPVDNNTGIAQIPENATNLTLYRCMNTWNSGEESKSDSVTSYWNKFGPIKRELNQTVFNVKSSSVYSWKEGAVVTTVPTEQTDPTEGTDETDKTVTVYYAVPKAYTDSGYTYRLNIRTAAGTYPHSARILSDTGMTYKDMAVYSYTFPENYVKEYDELKINRIQLQGAESTSSKAKVYFQYTFADKIYTISELKDKIFIGPDEEPAGTINATSDLWVKFGEEAPEPTEPTEQTDPTEGTDEADKTVTVYYAVPKAYTNSGYTYKLNIRTAAGTYPHSARILSDTGMTYKDMAVYSYTFPENYVKEYDELKINRIQLQGAESTSSKAKVYFQYTFEDKTYTISELKDKIFISPDEEPAGTINATSALWVKFGEETPDPTETQATSTENENNIELRVLDNTSQGWIYGASAKLYLYDTDTMLRYEVSGGKVSVPKNAVNFVLYRCEKEWGKGTKTDEVTTYWNKWDLTARSGDLDIICLSGDGESSWISSRTYEPEEDANFYLVGYFDGNDYTDKNYEFDENGHLSMTFYQDSYVYILSSANTSYWTNGWLGNNKTEATLYRAESLSNSDKFFVASGKVEFSLKKNDDGTLNLSYKYEPIEYDEKELKRIYDIKLGDVNGDGEVNIVDATEIQRYSTELTDFTNEQLYAADLYGNLSINVKCATLIQMYLADMISEYPVESKPDVSTLENLISTISNTLFQDYRYASYVAYSKLKTQYYKYKDIDVLSLNEESYNNIYSDIKSVYDNYNLMKENNNVVTVYFCNYNVWSSVRTYISDSETGKGINSLENAQGITKIKVLPSGAKVYEVTVDRSKWDKIVFTDGENNRTIEVDIPTENYVGFLISDDTKDDYGYYIPSKFKYTFDRS